MSHVTATSDKGAFECVLHVNVDCFLTAQTAKMLSNCLTKYRTFLKVGFA